MARRFIPFYVRTFQLAGASAGGRRTSRVAAFYHKIGRFGALNETAKMHDKFDVAGHPSSVGC